jgi:hypothetical protein
MEYPPHLQKLFESQADNLITSIILNSGKPENDWTVLDWKVLSQTIAINYFSQRHKLTTYESVGNDLADKYRHRKNQDKDRIKNRKDQIDKRAFQKAIAANINDYKNKADAIRDLRANLQFAEYPDNTLRDWLKEIWNKPTKRGRPRKDSK